MKLFHPYNLAMELDRHFRENGTEFTTEEFYSVVEAIQATGSKTNQNNAAKFFKTLPKEEVIRRSIIVARLDKLLTTIKLNHNDISRSSTT